MMTSLYQHLSGEAVVEATVERFYARVLADARIQHFFANTDMGRQRAHEGFSALRLRVASAATTTRTCAPHTRRE